MAQLKAGGYRSAANYLSAAKRRHIELAFPWSDELAACQRDCQASVLRGIGPAHQCHEIDLDGILALELNDEPLAPHGPICPAQWAVIASFHLMRGAESSFASHGDMLFDIHRETETLRLPVSKTDTSGSGFVGRGGVSALRARLVSVPALTTQGCTSRRSRATASRTRRASFLRRRLSSRIAMADVAPARVSSTPSSRSHRC